VKTFRTSWNVHDRRRKFSVNHRLPVGGKKSCASLLYEVWRSKVEKAGAGGVALRGGVAGFEA